VKTFFFPCSTKGVLTVALYAAEKHITVQTGRKFCPPFSAFQHPADRLQSLALDRKTFSVRIRASPGNKELTVSISERKKEIRRRRKRRENYAEMKAKLPKADTAAKEKIVAKLKKLSPGADDLIKAWGLQ
jgi:hypothetical protein